MIIRVIKLILSILFLVPKTMFHLLSRKGNGALTLLTYHSIKGEEISKFAKHMDEIMKVGKPVFADAPLESSERCVAVTFDDGFQSFMHRALPVMLDKGVPATVFVTTGYLGKRAGWINCEGHRNFEELVMTEKQVAELGRLNVLVGSHSVTHRHLSRIERNEALEELTSSKRHLERIVGKEVNLLSFPYGSYKNEMIHLLKAIGYKRIFLNIPRRMGRNSDGYVLGRIDVSIDDWPVEYKLKFRGAYEWLCYAVTIKQKLKGIFGGGLPS